MNLTVEQYNSLKCIVENMIRLNVGTGKDLTLNDIKNYVDNAITFANIVVDDDCQKRLISDMEYQFKVKHIPGSCIYDDYDDPHNWYNNSPEIENNYFWSRYKNYLIYNSSIDMNSINLLEDETIPRIMNCLGNPKEQFDGARLKRGLIIGDVQSGKTATYSGLICKAADAGYKVVILLAGTTESLRQQTQERIDEGIIGLTKRKDGSDVKTYRIGVGNDNKPLKATSFTSCINDFVGDCDKIATSINSHNSLIIFVVKKNVSVLNKLYTWLHDQNADPVYGYINTPMLLIDDEADNASVNTQKDETNPTKTNAIIRRICNLFKNASYVGFTATPFANVFIDPDSIDNMKQADLFPEHFIYTLPTPSTYIGANKIFYEEGERYGNLRYITDIDEPDYSSEEYKDSVENNMDALNNGSFYYKHSKNWHGKIPSSLKESILCFFLANAVRDLRGKSLSPRSMLINMSRFVKVQHYIKECVEKEYNDFIRCVRFNFSDENRQNKKIPLFKDLKFLWEKHFKNINDISFDRVVKKQTLIAATEKIQILVVNSSKNSSKLDYKLTPNLRVIAIGGLALSRGLTLEGLLVSYFYRNTATFDVLMQMGRWFGYRSGYEDLFQVWTSQTSARWYAEISRASEELKQDLRDMYNQHLTPKDFGIKVRDNCEELQITARNKMRSAYTQNIRYSYYGNIYDTPYISLNISQNTKNLNAVQKFASSMLKEGWNLHFADVGRYDDKNIDSDKIGASRYFTDVPKEKIIGLLKNIQCSLVNMNFNVTNILDFIQDENTENIDLWDVVFEGGDSQKNYPVNGLEKIKCITRYICSDNKKVVQVSSRRRILGLREGKFALKPEELRHAENTCRSVWEFEGLTKAEASKRTVPLKAYFQYLPNRKPILIIMLVQPTPPVKEENKRLQKFREELGDNVLVAFAVGFPGVKEAGKAKTYKVNKVYYDLYMQDEVEQDEISEDEE